MNWTDGISNALKYIEEHLKEDIKIVDVANEAYVSSFYFQKAFRILCGFSVAEDIRYRRLSPVVRSLLRIRRLLKLH